MENEKENFQKLYKEYLALKDKINNNLDGHGMNSRDVLEMKELAQRLFDEYFDKLDRGEQHDIRNILEK